MRLTLTISEVAILQKLVHDRIRVISEETAFEADRRNDNQLSGLVKLGKKLKRQTDHDKDKRRMIRDRLAEIREKLLNEDILFNPQADALIRESNALNIRLKMLGG